MLCGKRWLVYSNLRDENGAWISIRNHELGQFGSIQVLRGQTMGPSHPRSKIIRLFKAWQTKFLTFVKNQTTKTYTAAYDGQSNLLLFVWTFEGFLESVGEVVWKFSFSTVCLFESFQILSNILEAIVNFPVELLKLAPDLVSIRMTERAEFHFPVFYKHRLEVDCRRRYSYWFKIGVANRMPFNSISQKYVINNCFKLIYNILQSASEALSEIEVEGFSLFL